MTITRQVKEELSRREDSSSCCSSWELKALLLRHGYYTLRKDNRILSVAVDDNSVARRLFYLLRRAGVASLRLARQQEKRLGRKRYIIQVYGSDQVDALLVYLDLKEAGRHLALPRHFPVLPRRSCCRKAYLRGAFLGGGSISISGRSGYHLEINCGDSGDAGTYMKAFQSFALDPSLRRRSKGVFIYLKNAEAIADYLRIIGAGNTLLELESLRVIRSLRGQVNRQVNCDTANLEKVVASSRRQLEVIDLVDHLVGLNNISPALREAAALRLRNREASLKELGEMLDPPVSKSAMSHRFRQLEKISRKTASPSPKTSKNHANSG